MSERFWKWTWEILLPHAQTPRRFPGKPTRVHPAQWWPGVCLGRDNSEPPAEKPGEVSSPRGTSWEPGDLQLIHHLSLSEL